jgi:hypothetical protein
MQPVTQQHAPRNHDSSFLMKNFALNGKKLAMAAMLPLHKSIYIEVFKNYDW